MCNICEIVKDKEPNHPRVAIKNRETYNIDGTFLMERIGDEYYLGVYNDHPVLKAQKVKIKYCPFCGGYLSDNQ
jgi:hypothetical protein